MKNLNFCSKNSWNWLISRKIQPYHSQSQRLIKKALCFHHWNIHSVIKREIHSPKIFREINTSIKTLLSRILCQWVKICDFHTVLLELFVKLTRIDEKATSCWSTFQCLWFQHQIWEKSHQLCWVCQSNWRQFCLHGDHRRLRIHQCNHASSWLSKIGSQPEKKREISKKLKRQLENWFHVIFECLLAMNRAFDVKQIPGLN